jgi:DHA2 family multidrug resistance protein
MDCFHIIGVITLIAAPLVLLTKSFKPASKSTAAH